MKQWKTDPLSLAAMSALAAGLLFSPARLQAQNAPASPYQGVSTPPPDDTIETSPDPTPTLAKSAPGIPARQSYSAAPVNSGTTLGSSDPANPDDGIVTTIASPAPDENSNAAGFNAGSPSRDARLVARPEDPDFGIVSVIPSPSNQLAEGTDIRVRLLQELNTSTTQDGSSFRGQVAADVYKEGRIVIPVGSELRGRVLSVTQGHRMGSPATLRLRPEAILLPDGTAYHLYAQAIHTDARDTRTDAEGGLQPSSRVTRNLVELGAGSGGGAATGAIFGGPVGAGVGALVGAGIVTAHLLLQHPHQAHVDQGAEVTFSLTEPMDLLPTRN